MTPEQRAADLRQVEIIAAQTLRFHGHDALERERESRAEWNAEYEEQHGVAPQGFNSSKFSYSPWADS